MSDLGDELLKLAAEIGTVDPRVEQMIKDDPFAIDPLYVAEQITGRSYKDDERTSKFGFCIMQAQRLAKDEINAKMDDTEFSCSNDRYKRIVEDEGYELVLKIDEKVQHKGYQPNAKEYLDKTGAKYSDLVVSNDDRFSVMIHESQYFYWLDGILLVWDTHHGRRNSADVFCMTSSYIKGFCCNWVGDDRFNEKEEDNYFVQSDGRERIRHKTKMLLKSGSLHTSWSKCPNFLWLSAHWEEGDHELICRSKYNQLPKKIQNLIKIPK